MSELDLGLFGPRSMSWKLHQDRSGFVGGVRALILQALSTRAMRAVVDFSDYKSDPWGRFFRTTDFIMTVTYAPKDKAAEAIAQVRSVHDRISGFDPDSQKPYQADAPELVAFVHNCFVDSVITAHEALVRPLGDYDKRRYLVEQSEVGVMLGARREDLPLEHQEVVMAIENADDLGISDGARRALRDLGSPRFGELRPVLAPLWSLVFETALDLLPPFALEMYGLDPWRPLAPARRLAACGLAQTARLVLPSHPYVRAAKYEWYRSSEAVQG